MQKAEAKTQKFELNPSTPNITLNDGVGVSWNSDTFKYDVPVGGIITLNPSSIFGCYLQGDDSSEMPSGTLVRVTVRDPITSDEFPVMQPIIYEQVKALTDIKKMKTLDIVVPRTVIQGRQIIVQVNGADVAGTGDVDVSNSYFRLICTLSRKSFF